MRDNWTITLPFLANATSRKIYRAVTTLDYVTPYRSSTVTGILQRTITNVSNGVALIDVSGNRYNGFTFTATANYATVSQGGLQRFVNGSDNSMYYFGNTNGTFDFAINNVVRARFTNAGFQDIWIFKVTSAGALAWAARMTSPQADQLNNFVLGGDDTLYIASQIQISPTVATALTAFFGPLNTASPPTGFANAGTVVFNPINQGINGFVSCFSSAGTYLATCVIRSLNGVTTTEAPYSVVVDDISGAVYIGFFAASSAFTVIDFNGLFVTPFSSVQTVTSPADGFILKVNKFGVTTNTAWCRQIGGSATVDERIADLTLDKNLNLYALVFGKNLIRVYTATNTTFVTSLCFGASTYMLGIVKYNSAGTPQWVIPFDLDSNTSTAGLLRITSKFMYVLFTSSVSATIRCCGAPQIPPMAAFYDTSFHPFNITPSVILVGYDMSFSNGPLISTVWDFEGVTAISSFLVYMDEIFIVLTYSGRFCMNKYNLSLGAKEDFITLDQTNYPNNVGAVMVKFGDDNMPVICSYSDIL